MDEDTIARLRGWLVGAECTDTESANGLPAIRFGSILLWVWALWRITQNERILIAYDEALGSGLTEPLGIILLGQKVQSVEVKGTFHDISIYFENGVLLEIFADSDKYESWYVTDPPISRIIAGPGVLWSQF